MRIKSIRAQEILDSRGNPTVRVFVTLANGMVGVASVPSGASTGSHEALELRDGGKRYGGRGVLYACKNVERVIAPRLRGMDVRQQETIDKKMIALDGTPSKKKLGANALLGVSLACARAAADASGMPLYAYLRRCFRLPYKGWRMPAPTMNVVNGGMHADNNLTVQEFMIIPHARRVSERVRIGGEVFHALKKILRGSKESTGVGDEGGFAPVIGEYLLIDDNEEVLMLLLRAIRAAGYVPGRHVSLGIDAAASTFFKKGKYYIHKKNGGKGLAVDELIALYARWIKKYPLISIEDGFAEDDCDAWKKLTNTLGKKVTLVGDDLFVTNKARLARGIKENVGNAILIKPNQIGTLTETMETIAYAQKNHYRVSISHRSGETADTFIADLAVAVKADFLKAGSLSRSERVEKYNRLMEIERELK